jgi:antitoxin (DNA-binding transcriptional repressor) of toxin-antitoxin stability system
LTGNKEVTVMQQINLAEVSQELSNLVELVLKGEEIVIVKDNQPVVKLVAIPPVKKRWPAKAGSAKGLVTLADDFDEPIADFEDYLQ